MPRHISLLFPGQGSQSIGMLDAFTTAEKNNTLAISEDLFNSQRTANDPRTARTPDVVQDEKERKR